MLLNEVKKQAAEIRDLKRELVAQSAMLQSTQQQVTELRDLREELHATLVNLQAEGRLVARR